MNVRHRELIPVTVIYTPGLDVGHHLIDLGKGKGKGKGKRGFV